MANKYGFKAPIITEDHYKFGAGQVPQVILQSNGQWDAFLPLDEFQNKGFETYGCIAFGTNHAIQTLIKRLYQITLDFSDRFLAKNSGTTLEGNDPQVVSESLRKEGVCYENEWPFSSDINTFEKFYASLPQEVKDEAIKDFINQFTFKHEWLWTDGIVGNKENLIKEALKLSPVGASVFAWQIGQDGLYYRPEGSEDNHWIEIYGYEDGKYWKIFDTYDNTHKKVIWTMNFGFAKRYHIENLIPVKKNSWSLRIGEMLKNFWKHLVIGGIILTSLGIFGSKHIHKNPLPPKPVIQSQCDFSLWNHVYTGDPRKFSKPQDRLVPYTDKSPDGCTTVTGTIINAKSEKDGDYHVRVDVDSQFKGMLNNKNMSSQNGYLVVEPVCENPVSQRDTLQELVCQGYKQNVFDKSMIGKRVSITGIYVQDMEHGWAELHPVTSIVIIP